MMTVNDWIRAHLMYTAGAAPLHSLGEIEAHVESRLSRAFALIRARVAMGFIRYESNRGRSPCYLEWLKGAIKIYEDTRNLDALLDAAFYAIAEFENPSREGTYYRAEKFERDER